MDLIPSKTLFTLLRRQLILGEQTISLPLLTLKMSAAEEREGEPMERRRRRQENNCSQTEFHLNA